MTSKVLEVDDEGVNWFEGKYLVRDDLNPLQLPDRDRIARVRDYAGPESRVDVRLFLSVKELEGLLEVAKTSPTNRVMVPTMGLRSTLFVTEGGYTYEVVRITGTKPRPEQPPLAAGGTVSRRG